MSILIACAIQAGAELWHINLSGAFKAMEMSILICPAGLSCAKVRGNKKKEDNYSGRYPPYFPFLLKSSVHDLHVQMQPHIFPSLPNSNKTFIIDSLKYSQNLVADSLCVTIRMIAGSFCPNQALHY